MGTKNATSTSTMQLPGYINNAYKSLISGAQQTASTPYSAYTGGFTPDQQQAFENIRSMWGASDPSFQAASGAYGQSLVPTSQTVSSYMSPYMSSVVDAAMANMQEQNAQQQQSVVGNAIAKGAMGGNRVGVAQSELARQQKLADNQAIANLYQSGYGTALSAAQADKAAALQAAQGYGNLGQTQMQTNLAQAASQLGAGTQQQQFDYQQYLNKLAFPYQQQSWLASLVGGLGSTAGGTTKQTVPQGNIFSQLLGGALGIASLWPNKKDGGRVRPHMAVGGIPYSNDNGEWPSYLSLSGQSPYANDNGDFGGYIPKFAAIGGGNRIPEAAKMPQQDDPLSKYSSVLKEGASNIKGWLTTPNASTVRMPATYAEGGVVGRHGYASGGIPTKAEIEALYSGILLPGPQGGIVGSPAIPPAPLPDVPTIDTVNALDGDRLGLGVNTTLPPRGEDPYMAEAVGGPEYMPSPPRRVQPINVGNLSGVVPYAEGQQFVTMPRGGYSQNAGEAMKSLFAGNGLNVAPDVRHGLLTAGLGMMASRSPFVLQGIGEGGLAGTQAWRDYQAMERENALARNQMGTSGQKLALEAEQIASEVGLRGAETERTLVGAGADRYDYRSTPLGMQIIDKITGEPGAIYPWGSMLPTGEIATPEDGSAPLFSTDAPETAIIDGRLMSPETASIVTGETNAALSEAAPAARNAQSGNQMLSEIEHNLSILPEKGLLEPGTNFSTRLELARGLNTAITILGGNPIVDEKEVAAGEDFSKATTRLGYELSTMLGSDNAASIVMNSVASVPNGALSREGNERVLGSLRAVNQRRIDFYIAMQKWSAQHMGSLLGFDAWFNAANPPERYALSAYVPQEDMEFLRTHPDTASDFNAEYGNGKNVAQYVLGR